MLHMYIAYMPIYRDGGGGNGSLYELATLKRNALNFFITVIVIILGIIIIMSDFPSFYSCHSSQKKLLQANPFFSNCFLIQRQTVLTTEELF